MVEKLLNVLLLLYFGAVFKGKNTEELPQELNEIYQLKMKSKDFKII